MRKQYHGFEKYSSMTRLFVEHSSILDLSVNHRAVMVIYIYILGDTCKLLLMFCICKSGV